MTYHQSYEFVKQSSRLFHSYNITDGCVSQLLDLRPNDFKFLQDKAFKYSICKKHNRKLKKKQKKTKAK